MKLVIIGVGLMGGSFALALKRAGYVRHVVGIGRNAAHLQHALELGVIDTIGAMDHATLHDADLVLLATPVGQMQSLFQAISPYIGTHTIVTDAGSTKQDVALAAHAHLSASQLKNFIPGHPIAGAEKSGVEAATSDLYQGRRVVLTPLSENDEQAVKTVREAWIACGAHVTTMSPEEHDSVFAAVSHLPHLLAFALVSDMADRPNAAQLFGFAGGGFRDFTRIASSHPEMWRDICLANRTALLKELSSYSDKLNVLRQGLETADASLLETIFTQAKQERDAWLEGFLN